MPKVLPGYGMRAQRERKMSDEATMDEAANTALLLEQHIYKKVAGVVNDFLFSDSVGSHTSISSCIEQENNMPSVAVVARNQIMFQIIHSEQFKMNLRYLVRNEVQTEMAEIRRMMREGFARAIVETTDTLDPQVSHALHQVAKTL